MGEVWVVMGTVGEYSDTCVWIVRAFADEEEAARFVVALDAETAALPRDEYGYAWDEWEDEGQYEARALDPNEHARGQGSQMPTYSVERVPMGWLLDTR